MADIPIAPGSTDATKSSDSTKSTKPSESTKDALIAVMEELASVLDPIGDAPVPPEVKHALAAPLHRARELAATLDGETAGSTSAYQMTLDAIEERIAGGGTPVGGASA